MIAKNKPEQKYETATFAAGCFWGVEAAFSKLRGVTSTAVGYTGGHVEKPTYEQVCSGTTGHTEAVQLIYNPEKISYDKLLNTFFKIHDPTTLNRQGPDIGSQYRSAIFCHGKRQISAARVSKKLLEMKDKFKKPIVTEILPTTTFYKAEDYHQKYFKKHPQLVCR